MPFVKCSSCDVSIHVSPINPKEFAKKFVEGSHPVYCKECFKQAREQDLDDLRKLKDKITDPLLRELAEQMLKESENLS